MFCLFIGFSDLGDKEVKDSDLRQELESLRQVYETAKSDLAEARFEIEGDRDEMSRMQAELTEARGELEGLQLKVSQCLDQLEVQDREIEAHIQKKTKLKSDLTHLKAQNLSIASQLSRANLEIEELRHCTEVRQGFPSEMSTFYFEELESKLQEEEKKLEEFEAEKRRFTATIAEVAAERDLLASRLKSANKKDDERLSSPSSGNAWDSKSSK